jgi:hypothetical protein
MHILPLEWSTRRWTYTQVSRDGDIAIYRLQHREGTAERFEVIVVQQLKERPLPNGQTQEAGEYYPRASQWGRAGWTCFTMEEAKALTQEQRVRYQTADE